VITRARGFNANIWCLYRIICAEFFFDLMPRAFFFKKKRSQKMVTHFRGVGKTPTLSGKRGLDLSGFAYSQK
jgi:hypothetical protein